MRFSLRKKPAASDEWCVAQDLRPFGFRVESTHKTQAAAERACRYSRYLGAHRLSAVREINARLEDRDEFYAELKRTNP